LIVELAVATRTAPSQWWDEDAGTIATAVEILNKQAEKTKGGRRRG
jgi:hypothetical protein